MPAWSCCWYSATMAWRVRRRHHSLSQTSVLHNPRRGMFEADILRETSSATLFTSAVGVRADQ
jgi:hypothetical protein